MKTNFQTQKNTIDILLQDYQLLKKYIIGSEAILTSYDLLKNHNISIHRQLIRDDIKKIYEKEKLGQMIFTTKLPHKGVELSDLKPTKTGDNIKQCKSIITNINKIIGRGVILNLYSEVGEQANMAGSHITELLLKSHKGITTNGIEINQRSTDFNDNPIEEFLKKDFLTIFSVDSVFATDYRKQFMLGLYEKAKLDNIPIIVTSKKKMEMKGYHVINVRLTDMKKNEQELIKEIFYSEGE